MILLMHGATVKFM